MADLPKDEAMRILSTLSVDDKMQAMKVLFSSLNRKMLHTVSGRAPLGDQGENQSLSMSLEE